MRNRNGSRGVTLFELSFTLAIVGVLAALAVPGMRSALRAAAVRGATFELAAGLQQVRATAIIDGHDGVLCLADAAGNCVEAGPARAWASFTEAAGRAQPLSGRELPAGVWLRATRVKLRFPAHSLSGTTGTLTICDAAGLARPRSLVVSQAGRVRVGDADLEACRS